MSRKTWKSERILTENGFVNGYITICDDKIEKITTEWDGEYEDLGKVDIFPGIIDVHNHGFGGWSMTDPCTDEDVLGYVKALASIGITGILPTAKEDAFEAIVRVMDQVYEGAVIYGIHSEGPFWARGGEKTVGLTWPAPDVEETERLIQKTHGKMKVMAIAPELPGAYDVIRCLHEHQIKVACCHTAAYAEDIYEAKRVAGFDIATHLGNGMRGIHHRNVGALGALLLLDNIYYEVITDLNHICPDMLRIMFKLQPYSKFCLISDSNFIAGLPTGTYIRYGRENYADEKGLILNSDGRICGSGSWVLRNIKQLVTKVGVPVEQAFYMASINPARYLGIDGETGSLQSGKRADMIFVNDDFVCERTFVGGKEVYNKNVDTQDKIFNTEALKAKVN